MKDDFASDLDFSENNTNTNDLSINETKEDIDNESYENTDLAKEFKIYLRLLRRKYNTFIRQKLQKNFVNIIYLTLDCPPYTKNFSKSYSPIEYITEFQKQYPDKNIQILIPLINIDNDFKPSKKLSININGKMRNIEKTALCFKYFIQNKLHEAIVYKLPRTESNIQVYGIYSETFSHCKDITEISRLQNLAPFLKSARIALKKFKQLDFNPDIIHCENIPFFLGNEFETKFAYPIKVLQIIKDFTQIDIAKQETFWASINLADKTVMKKICKDSQIKNLVAKLFKLHNNSQFYPMKDCLKYIYKNYFKFRKYIDKGEDIEENIIINKLNERTSQLFPQIINNDEAYYNTMIHTMKKANYWAVISKTYYEEIFNNSLISKTFFEQLIKTKNKSNYISYGLNQKNHPLEKTREIYQGFNLENFREYRTKNKSVLLKEFNIDRIKTNFVDVNLFKNEDFEIVGSLDSFYDAPLLFAHSNAEVFANGIDILFNTILKLFELHKNIQVVICIKDGLKSGFIKNWLSFLSKNRYLNGRWIFIDGDINLPKFLASSDMMLIPRRANMSTPDHYLAMHYGCIPIVAKNGILNDTIPDIFDDINLGCGFKTKTSLLTNDDVNEIFLAPVLKALGIYQNNPSSWNLLVKNCLNIPCGWSFSILERYNRIYDEILYEK